MPAYCERTSDLVHLENSCLRSIYDDHGADACREAARTLLIATATVFSFCSGPEALTELFEIIQSAQNPEVLS